MAIERGLAAELKQPGLYLGVYECPECGNWHLTTTRKNRSMTVKFGANQEWNDASPRS